MFRIPRNPRAFTLIEILTVVVILGIVSAVIVPQLGSRDDLRAAAGARQLMADVIYAQSRAISTQRQHFIEFNGNEYSVCTRADDSSPLTPVTHPISKNTYVQTLAVPGTALETVQISGFNVGGTSWIGFDEFGAPFSYDDSTNTITTMSNVGTITLISGSHSMTIRIEPYTGDTSVQ